MEKHDIDLGEEITISVKYAGKEYILREPTVEQMDVFRAKLTDEKEASTVVDLLAELGMPREVVMKMGVSKTGKLLDGMMELLTKKK